MIIEENLSDKENPRTLDMRTPRNDRGASNYFNEYDRANISRVHADASAKRLD